MYISRDVAAKLKFSILASYALVASSENAAKFNATTFCAKIVESRNAGNASGY